MNQANTMEQRLAALSPEQRALLSLRLRKRDSSQGQEGRLQAIVRRPSGGGPYPLTFEQERLWLLQEIFPEGAAYNVSTGFIIEDDLDYAAIERSVAEIVRRHEILRTAFYTVEGKPVQEVLETVYPGLLVVDLRHLGAARRQRELLAAARRIIQRPMDLSAGRPLRVSLLQLAPGEVAILLSMHHIVTDKWSFGIFWKELFALYDAYRQGRPSPLAELPLQYADFAVWQRRWLRGEALERYRAYWSQKLRAAPFRLELPTDHPRPRVAEFNGDRQWFRLAPEVSEKLRSLGNQYAVTPFSTLLALFLALLQRYTGQSDLLVGTPVSDRPQPILEQLIGYFLNNLILRTDLKGSQSFRQVIERVRTTVLEAYRHEYLPLSEIAADDPERDLGQTAIYRVSYVYYVTPNPERDSPLRTRGVPFETGTSRFDLTLVVDDTPQGFLCFFEYRTALFDPTTLLRMANHFRNLATAAAASPEGRFSSMPILLSRAERHQVLREYNATAAEPLRERGFRELFEMQATRVPEKVAVATGLVGDERTNATLSFAGLDARADRLAQRLAHGGLEQGQRVGVCLRRSPELAAAVLAVFKAGGIYVPLDPGHPDVRLRFIVEDAEIRALLTTADLVDLCAQTVALVVDCGVNSDREPPARPAPFPEPTTSSEGIAYVFYTSGSTGRPKGVEIPRRSLVNYLVWARDTYLRGAELHFGLHTSIAFDLTLTALLLPLISGNSLVVYHEESSDFGRVLADDRVDVLKITPSHLALVRGQDHRSSRVRRLIVGGETFEGGLARDTHAGFGTGVEIYNEYGPTEATVGCMAHRFEPDRDRHLSVPIGRPAAHVEIYLLDCALEPVADNIRGEIYVAGEGLARCYSKRPALSASHFLPNPFAGYGSRMYQTGDRARRLPGGGLLYLGRHDEQLKFHGHRIESGEISSALNRYPGVYGSTVLVRTDPAGQAALVAYYAARREIDPAELRRFLARHLIEETLPNHLVHLSELPLNLNGKIDHGALPSLEEVRGELRCGQAAPRSFVEEALADFWAEVLGLERVGVQDDFFGLGGHSLLATQVLSRVREVFDVSLPLRKMFEAPTLAELAVAIDEARRQDLGSKMPPLVRVPRDRPLPLSFAQERLWFLDQLDPGSSAYNMPDAQRLRGPLNVAALEHGFDEIVRRHEVLRTRFPTLGGEARQVISPPSKRWLARIDLTALPAPARRREARRQVARDARRPFDLQRDPPLRAALVSLGDEEWVLLFNMHHIASDGWSMDILQRELAALYNGFCSGGTASLPELSVQYADFAVWQRSWLQGAELARQLGYWRARLAGAPSSLTLPTDRPRPPTQSLRGGVRSFRVSSSLATGLERLSRRSSTTTFMTALAWMKVLLLRSCAQSDLVVGTPVAGRNHAQVEGLIGFFVNTLVLRTDVSGNPSFAELLARVRRTALEAYAHQDLPFERLVDELEIDRTLSHTPLFQVVVTLQQAWGPPAPFRGVERTPEPSPAQAAKFDLTLGVRRDERGLGLSAEYKVDLFDGVTIDRLLRHGGRLLGEMLESPELRVGELSLLDIAERHQVFSEWNDTARAWPMEPMVHERFVAQAAVRPEAIAIVSDSRRLSYGELDTLSNHLAGTLRRLGVGPEVRVMLLTDRTLERSVAIIAVLKAGGAYVSLDAGYPRKRLEFLVADAGAGIVLTQEELLDRLPVTAEQIVCLDRDRDAGSSQDEGEVASGVGLENLAYVIYTSGSSGRPKGVEIPHRGLSNLVHWHQELYGVGPEDRGTQIASPAFDVSVWEFWPYLTAGASSHIPDEETRLSSPGMLSWWRRERITLACMATPLGEGVLAEEGSADPPLPTRALLVGGDRLHRGPSPGAGFRLMNHYGPAEYSVITTVGSVAPEPRGPGLPPIGRVIGNTRIYVLDRAGQPLPLGIVGELYVAGTGLARGYSARPGLSASKFLPDPWGAGRGERMYRSGDLVRYRQDGDLDFVGRADHQVKIRGLRVELGEVESVLEEHPDVREQVVVSRRDGSQAQRLVAYVVAGPARPSAAQLRAYLGERLPDYMVPAAFVRLDALPLTPNGKVDRRALPAPEEPAAGAEHVAPRTAVEEAMAGLWQELLGLKRVSAAANFFELGGHSLLATRLISRLRQVFEVELPLREVFSSPTLRALSAAVERASDSTTATPMPPLVRVARDRPLPLSFAQERLWFLDQLAPASASYNMPMALRLRGRLDVLALARSFSAIVRRHEGLRSRFVAVDGSPSQEFSPPGDGRLPVIDLSDLDSAARQAEAQRLAQADALRPFDLAQGPLLRTVLVALGEAEHVLLLNMHHIISDGWSIEILKRELAVLYDSFRDGLPAALSPLAVQYADFAVWQRSWLQGAVLERQLAYWREQLAALPPTLELPYDRPRPALGATSGETESLRIGDELARGLRALGKKHGTTLFMTLLAAWQALLHRVSGQADLAVGSPVAGRNHLEIEGLIGFFVNTLVLRSRLSNEHGFDRHLSRVREVVLSSHAHQDLPFERLVEELQIERRLGETPLFQVFFLFQDAGPELRLGDLSLSPLAVKRTTADFDLTLGTWESESGLGATLQYADERFDPTTIRRLLGSFHHLLEAVVADPSRAVSRLSLLGPSQRHQVWVEWNPAAAPRSAEAWLPQRFAAHAASSPDRVALVAGDQALSYAVLEARANRLAHALCRRGVGPETRVGICHERSWEMVVATLAVLKAGAAYVPLDPEYPRERLEFLLEDSAAGWLLAPEGLVEGLEFGGARLTALAGQQLPAIEQGAPKVELGAADAAYVMYSSGSTGAPKGIVVSHGALANFIDSAVTRYAIQPQERVLQFNSWSFDISVEELCCALTQGATLILRTATMADSISEFLAYCAAWRVNVLDLPTAYFHELAGGKDESATLPLSVRLVILGGEEARSELVARWWEWVGESAALVNGYGPTEATVIATQAWLSPVAQARRVPLGRPLSGMKVYLLDRHLQAVPQGAAGELSIGGAGLARGYWRRPALTATSFVPDPSAGVSGVRLYRTGDLARHRPNGELEFLGRRDHQVKLRGFRIELGEIESALAAHPEVRDAVVSMRENRAGDHRLVAYLVAPGRSVSAVQLRAYLGERLPEYMVPSAFVVLEALPLTPNGKVDRRALPVPKAAAAGAEHIAPRNRLELELAHLFEELLAVRSVGVRDNFFSLGGHSLLAVRLVARIAARFRQQLPLATLFRSPTVAQLAVELRRASPPTGDSPLVALRSGGAGRPLFFVHAVGGGAFSYLPLARRLGRDRPVYAFQSQGLSDGRTPQADVEAMASRYLGALRRVQTTGPYLLGGWSMGGVIAYEMAQQLASQGEEVAQLILIDSFADPASEEVLGPPSAMASVGSFARHLGWPLERLAMPGEAVRQERETLLTHLWQQGQAAQLVAEDLDLARFRQLFEVFESNLRAANAYRVKRPHHGRVQFFQAAEQPTELYPAATWSHVFGAGLEVFEVPGDHFTMLADPHVASLAARLAAALPGYVESA